MRTLNPEEVDSVLGCAVPARLASLDDDGYPYLTPIWFTYHDGVVRMTSLPHRPHVAQLRRDPRAALVVDLEGPPSAQGRPNVQVKCRGTVALSSGADQWTRQITLEYTGSSTFAGHRAADERVLIELRPEQLVGRAAGPAAPARWWTRTDGTRPLADHPSHPNAETIRAFYAAFTAASYTDAVRAFLDEQITWHVAGDNPLAGDFHGVDAVVEAMQRYGQASGHTLELDTRSVFADDEHAVAIHVASAHRDDLDYRAHEIDVFHLADGRITQMWSFSEDQPATDALWR